MPTDQPRKTAIITGASSGIGRATALLLAESGVQVALVSRNGDRLEQLADRILSSGGTAIAIPTDITDCQQVKTMVQTVLDKFGRIDILVNSAGLIDVAPTVEASVERWQQLIQVNLLGNDVLLPCRCPSDARTATGPYRQCFLGGGSDGFGWGECLQCQQMGRGCVLGSVAPGIVQERGAGHGGGAGVGRDATL